MVGLSGGVDSAVAALLLRDAGYPVQGLFMSNWEDDEDGYCTTATDFQDARRVCAALDIPLHRVSFAAQYRERVFGEFLREYAAGRTPNPDVLCNREIKFGLCLDYARRLGATWLATGHYARLRRDAGGVRLLKALDAAKDQSYFLHGVPPGALARTLFPLGGLHKAAVRKLAHAAGLCVHDKPDSTGICFIGERPFQEFLARYLHGEPGPIETADGVVIGEHRGLALYTLGQRSGLRVGGRSGAAAAPWYVAAKDLERRALVVVQDPQHPLLMADAFEVERPSWIGGEPPATRFACSVKTRYRQTDLACDVRLLDDGGCAVALHGPTRAVTPGQFAVFYRGEECLGGGVIARRAHPARAAASRPTAAGAFAFNS